MTRKCFFSFHYEPDNWRVSQVRNIGVIEGNQAINDNKWEEVIKKGDSAIKEWIDGQISGKSCTVVLAGSNTANRKWINYEIVKSWDAGKGVVVIYIHNLLDKNKKNSTKGNNPLDYIQHGPTKKKLSTIANAYDPPYTDSKKVYNYIADNIESWIEEAIKTRNNSQ